jgi:phospholipase C
MGYYDNRQIPGYWDLASRYVIADRYFQSFMGPTIPNRLYSMAGQSGGLQDNNIPSGGLDIPTVFDQLEARGITWRYYATKQFAPLPTNFPRLKSNPNMLAKIVPMDHLLNDIRAGTLPSLTYVDPVGVGNVDEHPPSNVSRGEQWTMDIIRSIMAGPQWSSGAIFLTWDESGGYFDHVAPPQVDSLGYGFRVPLIVVSSFAKQRWVDHEVMDHTSLLKFIARNWNLSSLTQREAGADDVFSAFDFRMQPNPNPHQAGYSSADMESLGGPTRELEQSVSDEGVPPSVGLGQQGARGVPEGAVTLLN